MNKIFLITSFVSLMLSAQAQTEDSINTTLEKQIQEVNIIAKRKVIEQKTDRFIYHIENSIAASGGNIIDALKTTPGVKVSDKDISIIGKSSISIMVDGRPLQLSGESLINYLQSISSDDIKSIEVMITPSSKYDAQGNSGMINIIYKKGQNNSWSNQIQTSYTQNAYASEKFGDSFLYHKNKWDIKANLNLTRGYTRRIEKADIYYPNELWKLDNTMKINLNSLVGNFAVDYQINKYSSIGVQYIGSYFTPSVASHLPISILGSNSIHKASIISQGNVNESDSNHSLNLHYENKLNKKGASLSVDVDYFAYNQKKDNRFESYRTLSNTDSFSDIVKALNDGKMNIKNYSGKLDFEVPTNFSNLSFGTKYLSTETNSTLSYFDLTSSQPLFLKDKSNEFDYIEKIIAGYFDLSKKFNEKWQIKLGLRVENTNAQGYSHTLKEKNKFVYTKLFPTLYILHSIDKNNSINLNYSKRITRPAFWQLNPFRFYLNSTSYSEGNPFLQPSYQNNFEFSHTYKGILTSTLYTSFEKNAFFQIPIVDIDNQILVYTQKNFFNQYNYGFRQTYIFNKIKGWESTNQLTFYYSYNKIYDKSIQMDSQKSVSMNFSTNNSIVLNHQKTLYGEVLLQYASPSKIGSLKMTATYSFDLGIKASLLNKSMDISLYLADIFKTSMPKSITTYTNNITQKYHLNPETRYIRLSLSYRLGNRKIKDKSRSFGNQEIKSRT